MASPAQSTNPTKKSTSASSPAPAAPTSATSSSTPAEPSPSRKAEATEDDGEDDDDVIFNDEIWTQNLEDVGKETMESLIWEGEESYVAQVAETVKVIKEAIAKKDLDTIFKQGHFLKGSSATIGLKAVPASCEKLQNLGKGKDESGSKKIAEDEALKRAGVALDELLKNHERANKKLEAWRDTSE